MAMGGALIPARTDPGEAPKGTDRNTDVCPVKYNYAIPCIDLVFSEFTHSYNFSSQKTTNGDRQWLLSDG